MRSLHAILLVVALAVAAPHLSKAQETLHNETQILYPQPGVWDSIGIYVEPFSYPLANATAIKITMDVIPCDDSGTICDSTQDAFISSQLFCGTVKDQIPDFVSALPGRHQEIMISPLSPVAYPATNQSTPSPSGDTNTTSNTTGSLSCLMMFPNYLPGPLKVEFKATSGNNMTTLVPGQQEAAKAVYNACCNGRVCKQWDAVSIANGLDVGAGEIFTDLCNVDNNLCDGDGNLLSWNIDDNGLKCDLSTISFSNFTNLEYLSMARNGLSGSFATAAQEIGTALPGLKMLDVGGNSALDGGLVDTTNPGNGICNLTSSNLQWLGIYDTALDGSLPACLFSTDSKLEELVGSNTTLTGSIPSDFSDSPNLAVLILDNSKLEGEIPSLPASLVKLNLTMNGHTGSIPDLTTPNVLVSVDLSNNQLDGPIPESAANHPSLRFFDVRANALNGIPQAWLDASPDLSNNPPLDSALLSYNHLNSKFPIALASYPNLTFLYAESTGMVGDFPQSLPDNAFSKLDQLFVHNNNLNGSISTDWGSTYIFKEDYSNNPFYTHAFIVANNSLGGDIPEFLVDPYANVLIDLTGNDFANACEPQFLPFGACTDNGGGSSSSGGGLSGGVIAAIVIVVLAVVGIGGFILYRRHQRHGGGAGKFQRFEDGLEMGNGGGGSAAIYNPQLAP